MTNKNPRIYQPNNKTMNQNSHQPTNNKAIINSNKTPMKKTTLFKTSLLFLSCIILTALGFTILNADSTTTIGLDINTGNITSTGTITSQDLTIQKSDDTTLTIYSNTDDPTENDKLLIIQKGTTPLELFSVDEDGDVVIGNDLSINNNLAITGNITNGTWLGTPITTQYGGTGSDWSTTTQGNLPYFSDTGTLSNLAPGTTGQFLSQGSNGNPAWDNVVRTATFVVAASDSPNKEQADYVCDGTDDDLVIQAAINEANTAGGGKVLLMEGDYIIASTITGKDYVNIKGMGFGTVWNVSSIGTNNIIQMGDYSSLSSLKINGDISTLIAESQSVRAGNHCFISDIWIHETSCGITVGGKENVHISNYIATNIRGVNDWAAAFHIAGASSSIYLDSFYFNGCNRGCEIEDGAVDVYVHNGYLKDIKNYNATGAEAFSLDAHSHIGGGGVDNIVFSKIILENCDGLTAKHSESITNDDAIKNIVFKDIVFKNMQETIFIAGDNIKLDNVAVIDSNNTILDPIVHIYGYSDNIHINDLSFQNISGSSNATIKCTDNVARLTITNSDFGDTYTWLSSGTLVLDNVYGVRKLEVASLVQAIFISNSVFDMTSNPHDYFIDVDGGLSFITNNKFLGTPTTAAFAIRSTDGVFSNNYIENNNIWLRSDSANHRVFSNILKNGVVTDDGTGNKVHNNIGYTTENSGSASVSNGDTIAHGLASTPTYINLTTSNANHIASATSVGSANITIGLQDTAGNPIGVDETVYWEAEVR